MRLPVAPRRPSTPFGPCSNRQGVCKGDVMLDVQPRCKVPPWYPVGDSPREYDRSVRLLWLRLVLKKHLEGAGGQSRAKQATLGQA